jgi:hypothetical protein
VVAGMRGHAGHAGVQEKACAAVVHTSSNNVDTRARAGAAGTVRPWWLRCGGTRGTRGCRSTRDGRSKALRTTAPTAVPPRGRPGRWRPWWVAGCGPQRPPTLTGGRGAAEESRRLPGTVPRNSVEQQSANQKPWWVRWMRTRGTRGCRSRPGRACRALISVTGDNADNGACITYPVGLTLQRS